MKLGFVSAILADMDLNGVLETASSIGYDCVELMSWPIGKATRRYAGVTHVDVTDFGPDRASAVNEMAASHGVSISALGYYPNALSPDKQEASIAVDHIRKVIQASAQLGLHRVNTFVGRDWSLSVDDNWPAFLDTWKPLIAFAEDQGVKVGIENCPMAFTKDEWPGGKNLAHTPAIWRRMFDEMDSTHFGLNYDPSHMVWQFMDHVSPISEFADKLFHVHAKDAAVDTDRLNRVGIMATPLEFHTPKLPGLGGVNWDGFFAALKTAGYDGPVCVEVEDRDFEGSQEGRIEALRRSHDFLRRFWEVKSED